MIPLVLVKSYGHELALDIIKGILASNAEQHDSPKLKFGDHKINVYKTKIVTKYYKTQIGFFVWNDITSIPEDILSNIEGAIIYFDPDDNTLLAELDSLKKFVSLNNIEASYLITRSINDTGPPHDEIKRKCTNHFAFIDLKDAVTDDNNDEYSEVVDLLKNNVWSNVIVGGSESSKYVEEKDDGEVAQLGEEDIERHLNDFEDLLHSIQNFKILSQNMSREDVLNNAEKLAEHFAKILKDD